VRFVTSGTGNEFRAVIQDASKRATTTGGGDRGGAVELRHLTASGRSCGRVVCFRGAALRKRLSAGGE
jgi:hypothetical protein